MRALICGIGGQDGAYLGNLLLNKGYEVWGTSRDAQVSSFKNLDYLGIKDKVKLVSMASSDFRSVFTCLQQSNPDEIYFLSGQSSVGLSFEQPVETIESITIGALNCLEAIKMFNNKIKFYHASSSECFGETGGRPADEKMFFNPKSPYAIAKSSAHWLVTNYRESYHLFACNGILFNHESVLRPERFVTQKIIKAAKRILNGAQNKLELGRLDIARDWGWAPEYVEAMWLMLQQPIAEDFVIATGETHTLKEFAEEVFRQLNLDYNQYIVKNNDLVRPTDILWSQGNSDKAKIKLGWLPKKKMKQVITSLLLDEKI